MSQKPRRRWFRFRLRTLLVMVTILSLPLGWVGWELDQRRREKATIDWVEKMGGRVIFQSEKTIGNLFRKRVSRVVFGDTPLSDLSLLVELKNLEKLDLSCTDVSDVSPLAVLKNLKELNLYKTQVSEEQVEELRLALPNCQIDVGLVLH